MELIQGIWCEIFVEKQRRYWFNGLEQGLEKFSVKSFASHIGSLSYSLFGIFFNKKFFKKKHS